MLLEELTALPGPSRVDLHFLNGTILWIKLTMSWSSSTSIRTNSSTVLWVLFGWCLTDHLSPGLLLRAAFPWGAWCSGCAVYKKSRDILPRAHHSLPEFCQQKTFSELPLCGLPHRDGCSINVGGASVPRALGVLKPTLINPYWKQ